MPKYGWLWKLFDEGTYFVFSKYSIGQKFGTKQILVPGGEFFGAIKIASSGRLANFSWIIVCVVNIKFELMGVLEEGSIIILKLTIR